MANPRPPSYLGLESHTMLKQGKRSCVTVKHSQVQTGEKPYKYNLCDEDFL